MNFEPKVEAAEASGKFSLLRFGSFKLHVASSARARCSLLSWLMRAQVGSLSVRARKSYVYFIGNNLLL